MCNKKVSELRQSILKYNTELMKLKNDLETSEFANEMYNKIVIQKAICKKELDNSKIGLLQRFVQKFARKDERLICDYFKS